jgi:hypothetical protein
MTTREGCSSFQVVKVGRAEAAMTTAVLPAASDTWIVRTRTVSAEAGLDQATRVAAPRRAAKNLGRSLCKVIDLFLLD